MHAIARSVIKEIVLHICYKRSLSDDVSVRQLSHVQAQQAQNILISKNLLLMWQQWQ